MTSVNALKTVSRKKKYFDEMKRYGIDFQKDEDCSSITSKCMKIDFLA